MTTIVKPKKKYAVVMGDGFTSIAMWQAGIRLGEDGEIFHDSIELHDSLQSVKNRLKRFSRDMASREVNAQVYAATPSGGIARDADPIKIYEIGERWGIVEAWL